MTHSPPHPEISAIDKREPGLHATDKTIAVGVEGQDRRHMLVCGGHGFSSGLPRSAV